MADDSIVKKIPLTQDKFALVDAEDYDWLMQWKWHIFHNNCGNDYAGRNEHTLLHNKCKKGRMHRVIMNAPKGMQVDHINRNGLDNRRCNLRLCTQSQNNMNAKRQSRNRTSRYKGVCRDKDRNLWMAKIRLGKTINLGRFTSEEEAALSYNDAAIKYFGEFARLNIIKEGINGLE